MNPINPVALGYNPAPLIGTQSLLSTQQQYQTLADLVSQYAPGAISTQNIAPNSIINSQIQNISFSKAQGGSLQLGGQNNQNGTFILYDANGNEVIFMDNTGMTVNNGKITIQDNNNATVIDPTGLVSTNNFPNGTAIQSGSQSTNSSTYIDIPSTTLTFTLPRSANIFIVYSAIGYNNNNISGSDNCLVTVNIDGADQTPVLYMPGSVVNSGLGYQSTTGAASKIVQLGSGSHTLKLRMRSLNGSGTAFVGYADISYVVLGS